MRNNLKSLILIFFSLIAAVNLAVFYFIPAFRGDIAVVSGFHLGPIYIHFYGLLVAIAILLSVMIAVRIGPRFGISRTQIENALPWVVLFGLVGARLYFVFFSFEYFRENLAEIPLIWKGGLSIYGAIIGAALGLAIYAKRNGLLPATLLDLAAVVLSPAQAIGRFGNFFNEEAFGRPTDLPWKLYISPEKRPADFVADRYFHPAFLYEALWDLLVFFVLWRIIKNKRQPGFLLGIYFVLYSMGRYLIESLRLDSFFWQGLRIDQITALVMILIGLVIILYTRAYADSGNP